MTQNATPAVLIVNDHLKQQQEIPDVDSRLEVVSKHSSAIDEELWRRTEVLYTFNTIPDPALAPALKWIQLFSAGADHVLRHPVATLPITVTTVSGIHAVPIAEYVFGMLLGWLHRVPALSEWQREGHWPPEPERMTRFVPRAELYGMTLGVAGYGSIGRQIARVGASFGMKILAINRSGDRRDRGYALPGVGDPEGTLPSIFYRPTELHEMVAASDVTVAVVPLTRETQGWFSADVIRAMKPGSIFINIARGGIADEAALITALREGHLSAAILDVFEQEPLAADSPLWNLPNVVISPHVAGHSTHYEQRANAVFAENLSRYVRRTPLLNAVDRTLQY